MPTPPAGSRLPAISAVLFDLDDTLHDRAGSLAAFLADQHHRRFAGRIGLDVFVRRFLALDANGASPKSEVYPALLAEFGWDLREADRLVGDYAEGFQAFARPRPGARAALASLRALGLRLAVVSNGWTRFQRATLDALDLGQALDAVLISEAEGVRKPDPRIFRRAAERLDAPPEACLFVGDNPRADIGGARDAGMRTAWIPGAMPWPEGLARADIEISALGELASRLPSLR